MYETKRRRRRRSTVRQRWIRDVTAAAEYSTAEWAVSWLRAARTVMLRLFLSAGRCGACLMSGARTAYTIPVARIRILTRREHLLVLNSWEGSRRINRQGKKKIIIK